MDGRPRTNWSMAKHFGWGAFFTGYRLDENPYGQGSLGASKWSEGWLAGQMERLEDDKP